MSTTEQALESIAQVVREHFDLGAIGTPSELTTTHQRRHRKLIVETEAGRFLVKTYRNDPIVLDALRFQHRLSDHLREYGLPVAAIQRTREGKGIVEFPNWALELQRFVEGAPMRVNTETLIETSKALGRFHEVCRDLPAPPRDARKWRFSEVPRQSFQGLFELAREESSEEAVIEHCNAIALFLHNAAQELSMTRRSQFETGLIHGDWHGGNLLFDGDRLAAILDLEFAGDGCYLEDIAYAISNLCIRTTDSEEKMATRTNLLLDHYQLSRSLSYAEQVALYYAVGVKHVATVSFQMPRNDRRLAGYSPAEWMARLAVQMTWLAEQSRRIRWGE